MKPVFFLVCLLMAIGCHKPDIASGIPRCIYKDIKENSKTQDWMVGKVDEYSFQGKIVYSFEPDIKRIADGASAIMDADCNTLCHIGGFAGPANNQCNGENFFQNAVFKRTIWEKNNCYTLNYTSILFILGTRKCIMSHASR
jgi:hypothetical protein